jgi:hypothetical protein
MRPSPVEPEILRKRLLFKNFFNLRQFHGLVENRKNRDP